MINISIDARELIKDLDAVATQQIPFAMMKTLNATILDVQQAEQEHIARSFTLRRPEWVMNTVKINKGDWATKDNLVARTGIDPDRDVLSKFEEGGEKTAMFAGHATVIPIDAKRGKTDIVLPSNRPRALQLTPVINTKGPNKIAKGIHGTFLVQKPDGSGGIYQRVGRTIHMLFALKVSTPLPKVLGFVSTAQQVVAERLPINWAKWLAEALRTAR